MEDGEFIYIDNIDSLGEFSLRFWQKPFQTSCLFPVFKAKKLKDLSFLLESGYLTSENEFFICPLSVFFTQINLLKTFRENQREYVECDLIVFSKNFEKSRVLEVRLNSYHIGSNVVGPYSINKIINTINHFVNLENDIQQLDETLFQNYFNISKLKDESIIEYINKLEFKFFANSQSRVGKDNSFWAEIEISNLPENNYLKLLFKEIISKSSVVESINFKNDILFATYDSQDHYSRSHDREEIHFDEKKASEIKDSLKFNIKSNFNKLEEMNERLKHSNTG
jgi:hypothetical protein